MRDMIIGTRTVRAELWYGSLEHWLYLGALFVFACCIIYHSRRQPVVRKDWIKLLIILFALWQLDWLTYRFFYHVVGLESLQIQLIIAVEVWLLLFLNRNLLKNALDPTKSMLRKLIKKLEEMAEEPHDKD